VLGHVFVKALANCTTVRAFGRAAACAGGTVDSFGGLDRGVLRVLLEVFD
jgi:hypothetical protein